MKQSGATGAGVGQVAAHCQCHEANVRRSHGYLLSQFPESKWRTQLLTAYPEPVHDPGSWRFDSAELASLGDALTVSLHAASQRALSFPLPCSEQK